jgi:hypothetical protein
MRDAPPITFSFAAAAPGSPVSMDRLVGIDAVSIAVWASGPVPRERTGHPGHLVMLALNSTRAPPATARSIDVATSLRGSGRNCSPRRCATDSGRWETRTSPDRGTRQPFASTGQGQPPQPERSRCAEFF